MSFTRSGWWPALLLVLALLSGCATQTKALLAAGRADLPRQAELTATPFIAQERYQCGPAALAMSLRAAGIAAEADALVSQVYLPQRKGSLQVEMLAAGRRNGAFSMTIAPRMDALVAYEKSGSPAAVRQTYAVAARRWPDNLALTLGLGNTAYAAGDLAGAGEAFARASVLRPDSGAAFNNLAVALKELGRLQEARTAAERALALGGQWQAAAKDTLASIELAEKSARH